MTHQPTIAVTGVTGRIGGAVATELQDLTPRLRLLVRNPSRAPRLEGQLAMADYSDAAASREALAGVDVLFMVSAGESPERVQQHEVFVDAAAAAGVKHIVYTSFLGAKPDATFTLARDHWYTEQHIRESGIVWTFLRDSFYLDFFPEVVDENGVIRGPAGNGRVGAVSREDVARSATAVLRNPAPHAGCAYDMTGPQALSLNDIARIIGEVWGKRHLPGRELGGGVCITRPLRRSWLGGRRLGLHLHRDRLRRTGCDLRQRPVSDRQAAPKPRRTSTPRMSQAENTCWNPV
jgi:predicted nucleoside-diphosphate sugar epimerase